MLNRKLYASVTSSFVRLFRIKLDSARVPENFDPEFYLSSYPDVALSGMSPQEHYSRFGCREGCDFAGLEALPVEYPQVPDDFDPEFYLATYPDIARAGVDPREHYAFQGIREGRLPARRKAGDYENWLWRGLREEALPLLEGLLESGNPRDRDHARWVLARWYCAQENWEASLELVRPLLGKQVSREICNQGADLLAITAAQASGNTLLAHELVAGAIKRHGMTPDLYLARMALDLADAQDAAVSPAALAELFRSQGLAPVRIRHGGGELFDRLEGYDLDRATWNPDKPAVSVIIPVFNAGQTLGTALRGLCDQSWKALDMIIVDDGSSDNTLDIAAEWASRDGRIRVLRHEQNQGVYAARNTGLNAAQGDFITVHDADDWSHPDKIARQADHLLSYPDRIAVFSHHARFTNGLMPKRWRMEDSWIFRNLSSLMFRKEVRERIGYWDRVKAGADTEYHERMILAYGAGAIDDVLPGIPLSFVRMAPTSISQSSAFRIETQLEGPRRDYMITVRRWHSRLAEGGSFYLSQLPDVRPFIAPPGFAFGASPEATDPRDVVAASSSFDAVWYIAAYPEARGADVDAAAHFLEHGAQGRLDPGPYFSASAYMHIAKCEGENPLLHWEREGKRRGVALPVSFEGALAEQPEGGCVLVFAHACRPHLFGAEQSLLYVLEDIRRGGRTPIVVLPQMENVRYLEALLLRTARVIVLPYNWRYVGRPEPAGTLQALRELIRQHRPDEVCVNSSVLRAPMLAARAEGVRTTMYVRELLSGDDTLSDQLGGSAETIRLDLLNEADHFIVPSLVVADWLRAPERTDVIPNRVSEELFSLPYAPQAPLRVGLVGSLTEKKGLQDFLDLAQSLEEQSGIVLVLVGPVPEGVDWPPNVILSGYKPFPEDAIAAVDVVMNLSSVEESFGRTIMEAQAGGRPVVCYRRGALSELVLDGETGYLVEAGNVAEVSDRLLLLAGDREMLMQFSSAARANAQHLQQLSKMLGGRAFSGK